MSEVKVIFSAEERNLRVQNYVSEKFQQAEKRDLAFFSEIESDNKIKSMVYDLIFVPVNGFREIVLTAVVGLFLDKNYDPLNDFYDCNPRSIFEKGIWYALEKHKIPSGKSGPLNVAKNISVLDENWASGKKPEKSALAVVNFLRLLENTNSSQKDMLIDYFFFQFLSYAKSISNIKTNTVTKGIGGAQGVAQKLIEFVKSYPEAGTVPQFIIGKIIQFVHEKSDYKVHGVDESVFGTNTTSKKPADIWVTLNSEIENLYEITLKIIDRKRLDDCLGSLQALDLLDKPVTFICRIPEDSAPVLGSKEGLSYFKDKPFYVVDVGSFITVSFSLLSQNQIDRFLLEIADFIQDINRPIKTKEGWNKIFSEI